MPELKPDGSIASSELPRIVRQLNEHLLNISERIGGVTSPSDNVDIADKRILSLLAGVDDTDGVNVGQLNELQALILSGALNAREPFTYNLVQNVWDDMRFPVSAVRLGGTFPPAAVAYQSGTVLAFDTGPNNENVTFNAQLPHSWKEA